MNPRALLAELHHAALDAVHGGRAVERALRAHPPAAGPVRVLACGKAACAMAEGARRVLGEGIVAGEVTTKDGHGFPVPGMRVREAAHPLPDARSVAAADAALAFAADTPRDATLLVLISGGASALWCAPAQGLSLGALQRVTSALLRGGVDIEALNAVRRALSRIKGGGLGRAAGEAAVSTLAVSDVEGDTPATIGSGPTVAAPATGPSGLEVLRAHDLLGLLPPRLRDGLAAWPAPRDAGPGPRVFRVVASLDAALGAVERAARERGLEVRNLGRSLRGEARDLAGVLLAQARRARADGVDLLLAGGEPTVTVRGRGVGGRCQELALAFALARDAADRELTALFAGTDGSDGPSDAAGAYCDAGTLARMHARGVDGRARLDDNDANAALRASEDLFVTGPTHTNVTDLALLLLHGL